MGKSGHEHQHTCDDDPSQPEDVADAPMSARRPCLRCRRDGLAIGLA